MVRREENKIGALAALIEQLSDGQFHSGEKLGQALGITRSSVWKLIEFCRHQDIAIESSTNKGYRFIKPISLLDKKKIFAHVLPPFHQLIDDLFIFNALPSTNDYLTHCAAEKKSANLVCLAECQTAGKGRRGRVWVSPFAKNIYCSVLWHFSKDVSELSGLSLVTAIAIVKALEQLNIKNIDLKWPNDVIYQNQKLAGILVELTGEVNTGFSAVIGIGLNVCLPTKYEEHIHQPWIDLERITKQPMDRNKITGILLNELIKTLVLFQKEGLKVFIDEWQARDITYHRPITLTHAHGTLQGFGQGINEQGHLQIRCKANQHHLFSSGDVSVRVAN